MEASGGRHRPVDACERPQRVVSHDRQLDVGLRQTVPQHRVAQTDRSPRPSSTIRSSSRRNASWWPSRATPRSNASVASATRQPSPTPPTTLDASVRAPSKNTSLNSLVLVSWVIGPHLDARLVHRHEQIGQALVTRRVRIGAAHHEAPVGLVRQRRPDLLSGDHPLVAVTDRPRLDVGQVASGVGLRIALAPQFVALPESAARTVPSARASRSGSRSGRGGPRP